MSIYKYIAKLCCLTLIIAGVASLLPCNVYAADDFSSEMNDDLSPTITAEELKEKGAMCEEPKEAKDTELPSGYGIVPDSVVSAIYHTNLKVDASVRNFLILGNAILCYSGHFGALDVPIGSGILPKVPNIGLAIPGIIIWIIGILLTMIIAYYLVDISFKLGFAMLAMPIGIALWPFPPTKGYLFKIINIIFHSTGVFIFLCLGVVYAMELFIAATSGQEFEVIYGYINEGKTEEVSEAFSMEAQKFMLLLFAGIYGFRLVGASVNKYVKKFFPNSVGDISPMHDRLTQATDFAKHRIGGVSGYAADVLKTQVGRGATSLGGAISSGISSVGAGMQRAGFTHIGGIVSAIGSTGQSIAEKEKERYNRQAQRGNDGKNNKNSENTNNSTENAENAENTNNGAENSTVDAGNDENTNNQAEMNSGADNTTNADGGANKGADNTPNAGSGANKGADNASDEGKEE